MDRKDRFLKQHHQRRLIAAKALPAERCLADARKQKAIAIKQGRTAFTLLMAIWEKQLLEQIQGSTV